MIIFKTISALQRHLSALKNTGNSIGFVPTLGALHAGHLSLIQQSQKACRISVVSIFVNPTQFNDPKDFEKYPVTIENDCLLLEGQQTNILFLPSVEEMYPNGLISAEHFDLGYLEQTLEGYYRPGHYQGVCQVVKRMLEIVRPDQLFLGQKDYQQCKVISRLVHLMNVPTQLQIIETKREPDGLAMSSRNVRLHPEQRQQATAIYQQLKLMKEHIGKLPIEQLIQQVTKALLEAGFVKVDYVAVVDADTLVPVMAFQQNQKIIALIAAFIGEVRLIDNTLLN